MLNEILKKFCFIDFESLVVVRSVCIMYLNLCIVIKDNVISYKSSNLLGIYLKIVEDFSKSRV